MLMRYEPFREFDRSPRRCSTNAGPARSLWTPTGGATNSRFSRPARRGFPVHRADRREGSPHRGGDTGWVRTEGDQVQIAERPQGEFSRQLFLGGAWTATTSTPTTRTACSRSPSPSPRRPSPARSRSPTQESGRSRRGRLRRRVETDRGCSGTAPSRTVALEVWARIRHGGLQQLTNLLPCLT